ncbi:hypothetical protein [Geodermatophilus sp. CPCC 206100]|uniref:hypothetical protein n=1 Tax=Geodermatophilus sp. CPCC 206100 TaxID=3020054 RepID=UPI003B0023BB
MARWTSFVADAARRGTLHEAGHPDHRCRVEHDAATLLVHLSDEDGEGWTTLAVDRATRRWSVAQAPTQLAAATRAVDLLRSDPAGESPG